MNVNMLKYEQDLIVFINWNFICRISKNYIGKEFIYSEFFR